MKYWFVRSPFKHHSWEELLLKGKFQFFGIRNFQARNNIAKMEIGDNALFYSSSNGKKVFGIMKVSSKCYPDPSTKNNIWFAIDFKPVKTFANPISFEELKKIFPAHTIIKQPRVSVVELSEEEYNLVSEKGDSKNGK